MIIPRMVTVEILAEPRDTEAVCLEGNWLSGFLRALEELVISDPALRVRLAKFLLEWGRSYEQLRPA